MVGMLCGPVIPASAGAAAHQLPNPCKTFTNKMVDKLMGLPATDKPTRTKSTFSSTNTQCNVQQGNLYFEVAESTITPAHRRPPQHVYKRPKLGHGGEILVGKKKSYDDTEAVFRKHGVWVDDVYSVTLPHKGKKLYVFALAQSKRFKG